MHVSLLFLDPYYGAQHMMSITNYQLVKELVGHCTYVLVVQGMDRPMWTVRVWEGSPEEMGSG